jgi:hypothetical protein
MLLKGWEGLQAAARNDVYRLIQGSHARKPSQYMLAVDTRYRFQGGKHTYKPLATGR